MPPLWLQGAGYVENVFDTVETDHVVEDVVQSRSSFQDACARYDAPFLSNLFPMIRTGLDSLDVRKLHRAQHSEKRPYREPFPAGYPFSKPRNSWNFL